MGGRSAAYRDPDQEPYRRPLLPDVGPPRQRPVTSCHLLTAPASILLLIAFFAMPFASIECSGNTVMEATGYGVATGKWTSPLATNDQDQPKMNEDQKSKARLPVELWLVPAGAAVALALALKALGGGFEQAQANGGPVMVIGIVLTVVLALDGGTDFGLKDAIAMPAPPTEPVDPNADPDVQAVQQQTAAAQQAMFGAMALKVVRRPGYWLALKSAIALIAAGALGQWVARTAPATARLPEEGIP